MKRILSLDGGGIRGMFSLQILAAIEALFREEQGKPDLVLADTFDFFAGTSTGAIIAAGLAWGMPVSQIEDFYVRCGTDIFTKQRWYNRWKSKYRSEPLAKLLTQTFAETEGGEPARLGSARLRKLLLIVMRNASTGSPWPVSNNPHAAFNNPALPDCNLNIPLWQLIRGSTAAPVYFAPEAIHMGDQEFLFVDGAMTPFNNPTLAAVFMATLPAYGLAWPASREALHVTSIGTGSSRAKLPKTIAGDVHMLDAIKYLAPALLGAISAQQDVICRVLGDCVHGAPLDSEVQSLDSPSLLAAHEQKFTYVRYNQSYGTRPQDAPHSARSVELDDLTSIPLLQRMGRAYAAEHVRREHLYPRGSDLGQTWVRPGSDPAVPSKT